MVSNILVIDNDPAVREAFKQIPEEDGFVVCKADNGLQGIDLASAERPDLIFLDLRMPGIDGVETLRHLKFIDEALHIYIITTFANEYMDQLNDVQDEGFTFEQAGMPEKALEKDVFATPMLVRDVPKPMLKRLGDRSRMPLVMAMAAITTQTEGTGLQTIIV